MITFNSTGKVNVVDVKELVDKEINKSKAIAMTHIIGSNVTKHGSLIAASILGLKTFRNADRNKNRETQVTQYRKTHPKIKMSNAEIIRMIERGNKNDQ
jgi:2-keto-4-pentenoate hydratase